MRTKNYLILGIGSFLLANIAFATPLIQDMIIPKNISPFSQEVVDEGDYYILNTGEQVFFQRRENTYIIMHDTQVRTKTILSRMIQQRMGNQLQIVKGDSLGKWLVVEIISAQSDQTLSDLVRMDPSIAFLSPVLVHSKTGDNMGILAEMVVRVVKNADLELTRAALESQGLSLISKLNFTEQEYHFEITENITDIGQIFELTRSVAALPSIEWAEPNFLITPKKYYTPDDTLFVNQWHLNNTGQMGGLIDADIDAPEGWELSKGANTVIAIFDDGVDLAHEDLKIWANPDETGGGKENDGIDNDNNGYIDDYQGWDFTNNDNDPSPATVDDNHGTACAGVAGAIGNNAQGVTGSAMDSIILPIQFVGGTCTSIGNAMRYAGKYADVVSNSWGTVFCESELNSAISDVVNGHIAGARRGTKGAPVLFASGNDASGWQKFTLNGFPAGTYNFTWRFLKDEITASGYDTVWLDNITWPGGAITDFETDTVATIPNGFTSSGDANWQVVSDGTHAWGASGNSVKAGTIIDNQFTDLNITQTVGDGNLEFWVWVSSEQQGDVMEFYLNDTYVFQYSPGQYGHQNEVSYPASNTDTIAVGASTDGGISGTEMRSAYSQFGVEIDVVSPSNGGFSAITTTDRTGTEGYDDSSDYVDTFGGTSSATPLVAGIVADMIAYNPTLTAAEIRTYLRQGTDQIGPYTYTADRNDYYGYGRVNLYKTLDLLPINPNSETQNVDYNNCPIPFLGGMATLCPTGTGDLGATTVQVLEADVFPEQGFSSNCSEITNAVPRYFDISPTTAVETTVRLYYDETKLNGNVEANLDIWNCTGTDWVPLNATPYPDSNYVEVVTNSFSPFILSDDAPVYVDLARFKGSGGYSDEYGLYYTEIQWGTAMEINNDHFNILKSAEEYGDYQIIPVWRYHDNEWEQLLRILAQGDSSSYQIFDDDVNAGQTYFYKLEDIDLYGVSTQHGPINITVPE